MDAVSAAVPHLTSLKGLKRLLPHRFVGTAAHGWRVRKMKNEKAALIAATIIAVSFYLLVGFLCWLFRNGWCVLLLLLAPNLNYSTDDKEDE
jgi:hypothetical protein